MDGVMSALRPADRVRGTGVAGQRLEGVVASLAVGVTDRVDRRQVHDVETHRRDGGKPLHRGAKGPALDGAVLHAPSAFRTGEELVPCADAGAFPLDEQLALFADR